MSERPDEIYCHSKTWIVDDVAARVGSANCSRRSYTHDSELDVVVVDGAVDNGARAFARGLRMALWQELLRLDDPSVLEDHRRALAFFRDPPPGSLLRRYDFQADLAPTVEDRAAGVLEAVARHLRVTPETVRARVGAARAGAAAAGGLEGEIDVALEEATDHLECDPDLTWSIVDPDGR